MGLSYREKQRNPLGARGIKKTSGDGEGKKLLVLLGRMMALEAWSLCTKDLNGSKRVFNINFVET